MFSLKYFSNLFFANAWRDFGELTRAFSGAFRVCIKVRFWYVFRCVLGTFQGVGAFLIFGELLALQCDWVYAVKWNCWSDCCCDVGTAGLNFVAMLQIVHFKTPPTFANANGNKRTCKFFLAIFVDQYWHHFPKDLFVQAFANQFFGGRKKYFRKKFWFRKVIGIEIVVST